MPSNRAATQDIRPLEVAVLNLMPTKIETETQLLRLLGNTPLQVNITLINTKTYKSTHVSETHMERFYKNFDDIKDRKFDGLVITGAPVETMDFEDVKYWEELKQIMDYAQTHVTSTMYICWGAQAALYHFYGIQKTILSEKLFGIFPTYATQENDMLMKGLSDMFYIPHSRHAGVDEKAIQRNQDLVVLAKSKEAGISVAKSFDNKQVFILGHVEYERYTLKKEYFRDLDKGMAVEAPVNYFADNSYERVNMSWTSTANILFNNWLNYVYQTTPYDIEAVE
jgi:homoserine O-succinyltransferase